MSSLTGVSPMPGMSTATAGTCSNPSLRRGRWWNECFPGMAFSISAEPGSIRVFGDDVGLAGVESQLAWSADRHDGAVRHDRADALVARAQGRPGVRVSLVAPQRHAPSLLGPVVGTVVGLAPESRFTGVVEPVRILVSGTGPRRTSA